ncbi:MAG: TIM barrel protein [Cocleimonas sp.]
MIKHSANLGFLWQEHDLIEGIRAAKNAGFDAVECHWPFEFSTQSVIDVLNETNLHMVGLNTHPGDKDKGEFGLCAHHKKIKEARQAIDQALQYADAINCPNVHIMAGKISESMDFNHAIQTFQSNLMYASIKAEPFGIDVLIEPINRIDVPDYFIGDMDTAVGFVKDLNLPNLKIMFDCFHVQKVHGEVKHYLEEYLDLIGHIQIASYPDRHEPDEGEIDYADLFVFLEELGYQGYIGAEYHPRTTTSEGLAWMNELI